MWATRAAWPLLIGALLGGCRRDAVGDRAERPLEVLVANDAETLDPRYATDAVAMRVTRLLHAGLFVLDPNTLAPVPNLARSFHWSDPHTLDVELRSDVAFHSGKPLTADDVRATLLAFASPTVASRHARVVEAIDRVDVDDPRHLTVRLSRDHATLLTDLELPILRADQASGPPAPDGSLDGLGPFRITERSPGSVVLAPARGTGHGVVVRTVHDENARALRMHAGRADVVVNGFSPTLLPALEDQSELTVQARPGSNLTYMVVRSDRGPLADERVRRALTRAIDRAGLAHTLLADRAVPASTLLPPTLWAHGDLSPEPFDPASSRALLREAGAVDLHLTLLTSTDRLRGTIARVLAQALADVGVTLEVVPLELGTMLNRLNAGDFELATLQLPELTEPNVLRVFLHSSQIPPNGANRGRVRDPEVDRLLDEGDREISPERRKVVYAALEARVRERAWLLPLFHEDQIAVTSRRASRFVPSAEGRWLGLAALP